MTSQFYLVIFHPAWFLRRLEVDMAKVSVTPQRQLCLAIPNTAFERTGLDREDLRGPTPGMQQFAQANVERELVMGNAKCSLLCVNEVSEEYVCQDFKLRQITRTQHHMNVLVTFPNESIKWRKPGEEDE